MNRRELISLVGMISGGVFIGAANFLSGCKSKKKTSIFGAIDPDQQRLLEEFAEVILPKTANSPGAIDVGIGKFMNTIVTDCYSASEQQTLINGISAINEWSNEEYGDDFIKLGQNAKQTIISQLEQKLKSNAQSDSNKGEVEYYRMIKQLTIWGYLSSEEVGTKVLRHVPIPGRHEGCIPYERGQKYYI